MIKTERLILYPMDESHMRLWADDLPSLEKELYCVYRGEPMDGPFRRSIKDQLELMELDPQNFEWHTFWLLIRQADRVVVGALGFDRAPDELGEVEMGYGLGNGFEGNGYMCEAATAICAWALRKPGVNAVVARTDSNNLKSQRTLARCGFKLYKKDFDFWWKLEKTAL